MTTVEKLNNLISIKQDIKTAINVKIRHDKNWKRRKSITGKLKQLLP